MSKPPVSRQFSFWGDEAPQTPEAAPEPYRSPNAGRGAELRQNHDDSIALRHSDQKVATERFGLFSISKPAEGTLPRAGLVMTEDLGIPHAPESATPGWARNRTMREAPRRQGAMTELPLMRADNKAPFRSAQGAVSARRVKQIIDDPSTGKDPRIPASLHPDMPYAYQGKRSGNKPVLMDGNHRVMAEMVKNQTPGQQMSMFTPVRMMHDEHEGAVRSVQNRLMDAENTAALKRIDRLPTKRQKPSGANEYDHALHGGADSLIRRVLGR